jgi:hypothetical protein
MRFFRATLSLLVASLTMAALFSCGGGGGGAGLTPPVVNAFHGVYRSAFTRGISPNTELVIGVNTDGTTGAVLSDANGVLFVGSGMTTKDGTFNVLATPPPNVGKASPATQQLSIAATFYAEGFTATLAGALNQTVGGPQFQEPATTCPFQGSLVGQFAGGTSGSLHLLVNPHGVTSGAATAGAINYPLDGQTSNDGRATFHTASLASGTTWTGYIFILPGQNQMNGSGTWTAKNGASGTWQATGHLLFK